MAANELKKIIELINATGDNCIVLDTKGEPAYVLVPFDRYQKLVLSRAEVAGLTQEELLGKINRDIAAWKDNQSVERLNNWQAFESAIDEIRKPEVPESHKKSLDLANNSATADKSEDKYEFEPID